jgi:hypothetical protein
MNHLADVAGFDRMQHAAALGALVRYRTGFGHAVMIDDARAVPRGFDVGAGRGNARAGFAGGDDDADLR